MMKKHISIILISLYIVSGSDSVLSAEEVSFKKPLVYTASLMAVGYGALVATDEIDDPSFNKFKKGFSCAPRKDHDDDIYNYCLHPLWGSETYLRAREVGASIPVSFGFSLGASAFWEYLIEGWSQHPSSNDLVITTGIGWMIGELRYQAKQHYDKKWFWLIDPIHAALVKLDIIVEQTPDATLIGMRYKW